jgi:putative transposase
VFHVYARGNDRRRIYLDDRDRALYLAMLGATVRRMGWHCLAYCLMDNHVHLIIETPAPNLSRGMQRLQSTYAQRFNALHNRKGHLFQGRFGSVLMLSDEHLWTALRYVVLNPVKARRCQRPEQYEWSSHASVMRGDWPPFLDARRLLHYFEGLGEDPLARYLRFVGYALRRGSVFSKGV